MGLLHALSAYRQMDLDTERTQIGDSPVGFSETVPVLPFAPRCELSIFPVCYDPFDQIEATLLLYLMPPNLRPAHNVFTTFITPRCLPCATWTSAY